MDNIADRQQRYDDNYRTDSKIPSGKGMPFILFLFVAGIVAYALNIGGFRNTTTNLTPQNIIPSPVPTVCPTLYNGPQQIFEDGRLRFITPTPHPCQAGQWPPIDEVHDPTPSPEAQE